MQQEREKTSKKAWQKPEMRQLHLTSEQRERLFHSQPGKKIAAG
jgi:hypothetical protein